MDVADSIAIAIRMGQLEFAQWVYKNCPKLVTDDDMRLNRALRFALEALETSTDGPTVQRIIQILTWVLEIRPRHRFSRKCGFDVGKLIAKAPLELIQWLWTNAGLCGGVNDPVDVDMDTYRRLDVIEYLHHCTTRPNNRVLLSLAHSQSGIQFAAALGSIDVVSSLLDHQYPLSSRAGTVACRVGSTGGCTREAMSAAAQHSHLEIV